jgi:phosphoesterase RecJ-like protein
VENDGPRASAHSGTSRPAITETCLDLLGSIPEPMARFLDVLRGEDDFLVVSHYNPDGDALGSMAAMGHVLRALGKRYALYNVSGVHQAFSWLDMSAPVQTALPLADGFVPRWTIVLDSGDTARVGAEMAAALRPEATLNIDHHLKNPLYGTVNWVDTRMSSVGEMVALVALALGLELSGPLGEAVYLAIVSDTGSFSYGSTSHRAMALGAEIIRLGLDPSAFTDKFQNNWSHGRLKLFSEALHKAVFHCHGKVGVIRVTREMFARTGTTPFDTDGMVNYLRRVRDVLVAVIMREEGDGTVKFSLRSKGTTNVQAAAGHLGGGGHRNAAGGIIPGTLDQTERVLITTVCTHLGLEVPDWDALPGAGGAEGAGGGRG